MIGERIIMDNETEITGETATTPTETPELVPDAPTQTKPKNKKGIMIGIVAIAIVAILLISFMLMAGTGVEGKWVLEETVSYEPDGSVNNSLAASDGVYWDFKSDGKVIMGNNDGSYEDAYGDAFNNITWEYTGDCEINITFIYTYTEPIIDPDTGEHLGWTDNVTIESFSQIYEYEVDGDTLTLSQPSPLNDLTFTMYFKRAES